MNRATFWTHVTEVGDCQEWSGGLQDGYGWLLFEGRNDRAHRVAWRLANGPIPLGSCVLHSCDNRRCVRLEHLFLGDRAANNRDRVAKGRNGRHGTHTHPDVYRAAHPRKLSDDDVRAIRGLAGTMTMREIGRLYSVHKTTVGQILSRHLWPHLE